MKEIKIALIMLAMILLPIIAFSQVTHGSKQWFKDTVYVSKGLSVTGDGSKFQYPGSVATIIGGFAQARLVGGDSTFIVSQPLPLGGGALTSQLYLANINSTTNNHSRIFFTQTGGDVVYIGSDSAAALGPSSGAKSGHIIIDNTNGFTTIGKKHGVKNTYISLATGGEPIIQSVADNGTENSYTTLRGAGLEVGCKLGVFTSLPSADIHVAGSFRADSSVQITNWVTADSTFTIPDNVSSVITYVASHTFVDGTITMPANPYDSQRVSIYGDYSAVTVSANAGQTLLQAPTAASLRASRCWTWDSSNSIWFPSN